MSGFLYYLPHKSTLTPAELPALGLAHALDRVFDAAPIPSGPDGEAGLVVCAKGAVPAVGYYPGSQEWLPAPGQPWHLGVIRGHEPTPEDLQRAQVLSSREVELVDGHGWKLPVARRFPEPKTDAEWEGPLRYKVELPQALALGTDGEWDQGGVIPRYASLWQLACDFAEAMLGEPTDEQLARFSCAGQAAAAVQCLAVNYRVGPCEASRLGLLTLEHCRLILETLIDQPSFETLFKKKHSRRATASIAPGAPAASVTTVPPSPMS